MKRLVILLLCFLPGLSWGALSFGATEEEKKMLPAVCQGKNKDLTKGVQYLNHYCYGENFINRASNPLYSQSQIKSILRSAAEEISAAIRRNDKKHPFMPVMLGRLAYVKAKQKKIDEAVALYTEAIQLNRNYPKNYAQLSNIYKRQGNLEKALEVINEGLKHSPNSKYLKKKLKRLEKKLKNKE